MKLLVIMHRNTCLRNTEWRYQNSDSTRNIFIKGIVCISARWICLGKISMRGFPPPAIINVGPSRFAFLPQYPRIPRTHLRRWLVLAPIGQWNSFIRIYSKDGIWSKFTKERIIEGTNPPYGLRTYTIHFSFFLFIMVYYLVSYFNPSPRAISIRWAVLREPPLLLLAQSPKVSEKDLAAKIRDWKTILGAFPVNFTKHSIQNPFQIDLFHFHFHYSFSSS